MSLLRAGEAGQAAALMVVGLGVTIVMGVLVVDVGVLFGERARAQNVADLAALAAAQELPIDDTDPLYAQKMADAQQAALDNVESNGYDLSEVTVNVVTAYGGDYDKIEVILSVPRTFSLGRAFGLGDVTVGARAVAQKIEQYGPLDYAFLTLNGSQCQSFHANGNVDVTINGGSIMANTSCAPDGSLINGNVDIVAGAFDYLFGAGVEIIGNATVSPDPTPVMSPVPDPLAGLPPIDLDALGTSPDSAGTEASPAVTSFNNGNHTLRPGIFWGGISAGGNSNITLGCDGDPPCIYVMAGGGFSTAGNADVSGSEVLLFNTGPSCGALNFVGNGDLGLSPATSGDYEGLTFWQDASCTLTMTLAGNVEVLSGGIYVPEGHFHLVGNGHVGPIQVIVDTAEISGNGDVTIEFESYFDAVGGDPEFRLLE